MPPATAISVRVLDTTEGRQLAAEARALRRVALHASLHLMSGCTEHTGDLQRALMDYTGLESNR